MKTEKSLVVSKPLTTTQYLIIYFFIYAFIGWLCETCYAIYELGGFVKRGFLFGPICPIYGWGALILLVFLSNYKNHSIKMFFIAGIVFSAFEYIVGFGLDALFSAKWWDYSNEFFNLNGRISILFSFVWGIFALLFINFIHPFVKSKVNLLLDKIPIQLTKIVVPLLVITLLGDTIFSSIKYLPP